MPEIIPKCHHKVVKPDADDGSSWVLMALYPPEKTNIAMENDPFLDDLALQHGGSFQVTNSSFFSGGPNPHLPQPQPQRSPQRRTVDRLREILRSSLSSSCLFLGLWGALSLGGQVMKTVEKMGGKSMDPMVSRQKSDFMSSL